MNEVNRHIYTYPGDMRGRKNKKDVSDLWVSSKPRASVSFSFVFGILMAAIIILLILIFTDARCLADINNLLG